MATKKKVTATKKSVIYQAKSGAIELRGDFTKETLWATQAQIAHLFDVTPQNITLHLGSIFNEKELDKKATCKDFLQVQKEGAREVTRTVSMYNLDAIIAVGYRINSVLGTNFRMWATKTLRSYVVDGYVINKKRISEHHDQFLKDVSEIQRLLPMDSTVRANEAIELISLFADTWLSLDSYDRDKFKPGKLTKKKVDLTAEKVTNTLGGFRDAFIKKGEATELFGAERSRGSIAGIVGNVMQSFGGTELYPTAEEKAAHLLYFIVKNHPFSDGNKRSGAYAFVWLLQYMKILDVKTLTPSSLTALTILVAESDPAHKERITGLIVNLIAKK